MTKNYYIKAKELEIYKVKEQLIELKATESELKAEWKRLIEELKQIKIKNPSEFTSY